MEWGKLKSFIWGGLIGGLLGLVLSPRRAPEKLNPSLWRPGEPDAFSGAPCHQRDDEFT